MAYSLLLTFICYVYLLSRNSGKDDVLGRDILT